MLSAKAYRIESCQPEPVEGGFKEAHRLLQSLPDTLIKSNFYDFQGVQNLFPVPQSHI